MKAHLLSPNGALKTGWALTRKHFIVMLGLFLGIMILSWIVSMLGGADVTSFRYLIMYLVNIILSIWLGAGMNKIMLNAYAGEEPSFSTFSAMLPKLGGLIGLNLIVGITVLIPMAVGFFVSIAIGVSTGIAMGTGIAMSDLSDPYALAQMLGVMFSGATGVIFLICCFISIYLALRLMFAIYAYVDDFSIGISGAFHRSWEMTRGNMGKIILCFLMMIVLNIIGFIALIVGIVVTLIISAFMTVAMYEQIKASEQAAVAEAAEPARYDNENPAQPEEPGDNAE